MGQLSNDKLLNATEQAFNKAGVLPQTTCGSGKLRPINARTTQAGGRRLSVTAAVDVSLVYTTEQQTMYTKVKAGDALQSGLQTGFVQALQEAGVTQATASMSVGAITIEGGTAVYNGTTTPDSLSA